MKLTRKTTIFLALLLALVSLVTAVAPALAAEGDPSADQPVPVLRDGLAIVAPVAARPDQPVTMTVFQRSDQTPMEGAAVWVVTDDQVPQFEAAVQRLRDAGTIPSADTDWDGIVSQYGRLIGRTDARGTLTTSFSEGGRYLLVATKGGYLPGRTVIGIIAPRNALAIRAPEQADVNAPVTIGVYEQASGTPVEGAGVWALTRDQAEVFKAAIDAMQASGQTFSADTDWESLFGNYGVFLGRSGDTGEVTASFAEAGGYLLLAAKPGYLPARARILIGSRPEPLALQVQGRAKVGEEVPVHVMDRTSGEPVEGAGVWALTRDQAEAFRQQVAGLRDSDTGVTGNDLSVSLSSYGIFLGATDGRGNLTVSFDQPGPEVLVTWKPGCLPGFGIIQIVGPDADKIRPSDQPDAAAAVPVPGATDNVTVPATGNVTGTVR
jgi:hypothetical protein